MLQTIEPGTKPRPGVHCGGELRDTSATALRLQILTRRGLTLDMAELLAPFVWGGQHG